MLFNYSSLAVPDSTEDSSRVSFIVLAAYTFMASAIFVINGRDVACPENPTYNALFDNLDELMSLWFPEKIFNLLTYLGLYELLLHIGDNPVLAALEIRWCTKNKWVESEV